MTEIKVKAGMKFQHNPYEPGNEFEVIDYDFYDDGNSILCAASDTSIIPLDDIDLDNYIPMVNGQWVNEPVKYIF